MPVSAWQQGTGYRSKPLPIREEGRSGFSRLPAGQTGITFTNVLRRESAAVNRILENGSGVALGDVDGDGLPDIYFCRMEGGNVLYRNLGNWKFEDITAKAGVACENQFSTGTVFADIDGDGDLDLLVNSIGGGTRLFLNDGKGRFTEAASAGLIRRYGSTSLALADIDGDGTLDLYVANYRTTNYKDSPPGVRVDARRVNGRIVVTPADRFEAVVTKDEASVIVVEKGEPDVLYLNDGNGRFTPVPWTGGAFLDEDGKPLEGPTFGWGLSVMFRDMTGNGAPDIYICNDFFYSRDRVWINDGKGRFQAIAELALRNMSMSSMAIDFADINRNGLDDFFVVDMLSRDHQTRQRQRANVLKGDLMLPISDPRYRPEVLRNTLFLNRGDGTYAEIAQLSGLHATEWSWGAIFLDVDLDGYEDLLITTGNLHDVLDADMLREISRPGAGQSHLKNLLKFPTLEIPNLAFRNRGDLTFEETGAAWGFNTTGISHGMALADLDGDGALDVVVNNLNAPAGIYRNNSAAPRLAVRLKGSPPNTQGIGATIRVTGGPVPQSQAVICGGRYASGDDPLRVFAAGSLTNVLTVEVNWRSGKRTRLTGIKPNLLIEIEEPETNQASTTTTAATDLDPFFEDVSALLAHQHEDAPFDEFERQPLLTHRLDRLGPAVAWHDVDGDGWDDLIIGAGKGGRMAVFRNNQKGGFDPYDFPALQPPMDRDQTGLLGWRSHGGVSVILSGASIYEDGSTNSGALRIFDGNSPTPVEVLRGWRSAMGPMAMADMDGDGDLDLFVGGRAMPGRFPEPASSVLFRNENGRFRIDPENTRRFAQAGMVSGALFSDLDGDGAPDLLLACDWGPIRIFRNDGGAFIPWNAPLTINSQPSTLNQLTGRWNGIAAGDFDGDGRMDFIASNWGRNTKYQEQLEPGLGMFHADFIGDGTVETIEAYYEPTLGKIVPWPALDAISRVLPFMQERFETHRAYGRASVEEVLGPHFQRARELRIRTLDSMVFLNRSGHFEARPLPIEAQFAPAFGIAVADFDGDGQEDVFLSQNFFGVDPETSRYDAGRGLWLRGDGSGNFQAVSGSESGIKIYGEQRACAASDFDGDGRIDLVVAQNGGETKLYKNRRGKPGVRIRLKGPPENPNAIGAILRIGVGDQFGPAREIHAGSGYWSQSGAVQVMARAEAAATLWIRWPGGQETRFELPIEAVEVEVTPAGILGVRR